MIKHRTERHIIHQSDPYFSMLDEYCYRAKNLYNYATYIVRNHLFTTGKWLRYNELDKLLKADPEYTDYRDMPYSACAQQTLRHIDDTWNSYFSSHKDWKMHPEKYTGEPKLPKYKDKIKGRDVIYLTNQACKLQETGLVTFPKSFKGFSVKLKASNDPSFAKFKQCRILPRGNHIVVEFVYDAQMTQDRLADNSRYLGIDLGVDNLAAVSNNVGAPFYVIDGKGLKSINRYWNKLVAKAQSDLNRTKKRRERRTSNKIERLTFKRNQRIEDYLHKSSRWIVNFAQTNHINTIVIGKNKLWKQEANLGKKTNQKFVQIPHAKLIEMVKYKAEEFGIDVVCVEESYTSKTSFMDNEDPCKHEKYAGSRITRGLFKTANGYTVNADSNGAMQIIKKHIEYEVSSWDQVRIALQQPIRLNVN